jgi:type I restriction enzyme S subunit
MLLRSQNVHFAGLRLDDVAFIDAKTDSEMMGSRVREKDVLLNITGASLGRCCVARLNGMTANVNQHICIIRPRKEVFESAFLAASIASQSVQAQIFNIENGISRDALNFEQIGQLWVGRPPAAEQNAIAAFLDRETTKINALIARKKELIELLQEKRTALITRAVAKGLNTEAPLKQSGIEWLGEIPAHWRVMRIRDIADTLQTGPFGSQLHADEYVLGGHPVINPANLRDGKLVQDPECTVDDATASRLQQHRLREGDILFARRGELGRCGLVSYREKGWLCGTGCLRLRVRIALAKPCFLMRLLSTSGVADWLDLQSVGSTMQNLNTGIIGRIPIAVPPTTEQDAIAAYLDPKVTASENMYFARSASTAKIKPPMNRRRDAVAA